MRTSDNMKGTLADIASLVKDEFKTISTSYAILLVLVGGIFLYGLLYNYMYAPDLVRNAPVVVVDDSKTDLSREYIRLLNATSGKRCAARNLPSSGRAKARIVGPREPCGAAIWR